MGAEGMWGLETDELVILGIMVGVGGGFLLYAAVIVLRLFIEDVRHRNDPDGSRKRKW